MEQEKKDETGQATTETAKSDEESLYGKEEEKETESESEETSKSEEKEVEVEKPKEEAKTEEKKEEKIELKAPENSQLSQERIDEIAAYCASQSLSGEVAQKMVDRENDAVVQAQANAKKQLDNMVDNEWPKLAKEDKEIGGDKFPESVENAKRAFKKFGSDEFNKILTETGYGNHPEMIRTFARIGKVMANDSLIQGQSGKTNQEKSTAEVFYGT